MLINFFFRRLQKDRRRYASAKIVTVCNKSFSFKNLFIYDFKEIVIGRNGRCYELQHHFVFFFFIVIESSVIQAKVAA